MGQLSVVFFEKTLKMGLLMTTSPLGRVPKQVLPRRWLLVRAVQHCEAHRSCSGGMSPELSVELTLGWVVLTTQFSAVFSTARPSHRIDSRTFGCKGALGARPVLCLFNARVLVGLD